MHIGSKIKVYDADLDEEDVYEITGTTELDISMNKISNLSPVGKALMGHKVGDVVTIVPENNNPVYTLKIEEISLASDNK